MIPSPAVPLALLIPVLGLGCASSPSGPVDISGVTTVEVRFELRGREEIEVRGLRFRHRWTETPAGSIVRASELRRNETRRTLDEAEFERVLAWIDEHEVLTLTDPRGRRDLPTLGVPSTRILEVSRGGTNVGIGWDESSSWRNPAMGERVRVAVERLRELAADLH